MNGTKDNAIALLKQAHLRITVPRAAVLTALLAADRPLTQEQIAERLGADSPNKTTIYRTLVSLMEQNLIHKAYIKDRVWHFEPAHHCGEHQCHPHFTCLRCNQTQCLTSIHPPLIKGLPDGYRILRQQIRLEGLCDKCRQTDPGTR